MYKLISKKHLSYILFFYYVILLYFCFAFNGKNTFFVHKKKQINVFSTKLKKTIKIGVYKCMFV